MKHAAELPAAGAAVGAFVLAVFALHPFGNVYYGGDDWAYAWSSRLLLEHGQLRASVWSAAAAVPQTVWGALFGWLFGVRPLVMNAATLVFSTIGVGLLHAVGRRLGLSEWRAALVAVLLSTNALYLGFASSFMSDAYYTVLMLAAVLAYLEALRTGSFWMSVLGGFFAGLALLNRQIGLVLAPSLVAAALTNWLAFRWTRKQALLVSVGGASLPCGLLILYRAFPDWFGGVTLVQRTKIDPALRERLMDVGLTLVNGHATLIYVGVFSAPLVAMLLAGERSRRVLGSKPWRLPFVLCLLASVTAYVVRLAFGKSLIVRGEFLQTASFGAPPLALMNPCWTLLALIGSVCLPALALLIVERIVTGFVAVRANAGSTPTDRAHARVSELVFLAAAFSGHFLLVASFVTFLNNYFLPLVVLAGALVAAVNGGSRDYEPRCSLVVGGVLSGLVALTSVLVLAEHDRYVEADARVEAELVAAGIDSRDVFGFCSWFAERHYDLVAAEIKKSPWAPLEHIRDRTPVIVLNPEQHPRHKKQFRRVRSETYETPLGTREIVVWRDTHFKS